MTSLVRQPHETDADFNFRLSTRFRQRAAQLRREGRSSEQASRLAGEYSRMALQASSANTLHAGEN